MTRLPKIHNLKKWGPRGRFKLKSSTSYENSLSWTLYIKLILEPSGVVSTVPEGSDRRAWPMWLETLRVADHSISKLKSQVEEWHHINSHLLTLAELTVVSQRFSSRLKN